MFGGSAFAAQAFSDTGNEGMVRTVSGAAVLGTVYASAVYIVNPTSVYASGVVSSVNVLTDVNIAVTSINARAVVGTNSFIINVAVDVQGVAAETKVSNIIVPTWVAINTSQTITWVPVSTL